MKHLYAVETKEELQKYQEFVHEIEPRLREYIDFLKKEYEVIELPRAIVWASEEIATKIISDIPVPAYTNEFRVVMAPELETWSAIYLKQLDGLEEKKEIQDYYTNSLSQNHVMQILGHELAHHSELFLEDFESYFSDGIWFEEGMVEYISRRYFLSEEEFHAEAKVNQQLVDLLKERYGKHSLEQFLNRIINGLITTMVRLWWNGLMWRFKKNKGRFPCYM